ncbi:cytochrome P450 [Coprinellus micaceus]|uniref:Cytochrome P450 n=1 Tax=Coprinellus micaceus TaxID=71717 RepID=A0A4Y7SDJ0_COPMI|nr:cytochrome P450 [Coprinellus micaceus]
MAPTLTEVLGSGVLAFLGYQWFTFQRDRRKVAHIPTLGSDWFILSYFSAWKFIFKGHFIFQEGYQKFKGLAYKIPTHTTESRWLVVVSGLEMVEDLRKASPEVLSFRGASADLLQTEHTMPTNYNSTAFPHPNYSQPNDQGPTGSDAGSDWKTFPLHKTLVHVVCRTTNRLFVDLPLCRNPEYLKIQESWTTQVGISANLLNTMPAWFRPILAKLLVPMHASEQKARKILTPVIQERLQKYAQFGDDWEGKPNDLITWLIESAPVESRNVKEITIKVMLTNFASIHTTSLTATNALFDLAIRPEYVEPLRAEIEEVIGAHGWTKEAMGHLVKLDSFMKESSRLAGISVFAMRRKAMQDFVFTNGLVVPQGVTVCVSSGSMQTDDEYYEDANSFKGFRYYEKREKITDELDSLQHQMVSLDPTYMLFGYGRMAPGRFFAVNEVKAILAHLLLHYDFKVPGDANKVPDPIWFGGIRNCNPNAQALIKKREVN